MDSSQGCTYLQWSQQVQQQLSKTRWWHNQNITNNFINNSAESGGAINTYKNVVLTFNGTNNFSKNSANDDGGAIHAFRRISLSFTGTSNYCQILVVQLLHTTALYLPSLEPTISSTTRAKKFGGTINMVGLTIVTFGGTNVFSGNLVNSYGGGKAIFITENVSMSFDGANTFSRNSAGNGGADNIVSLTFNGTNNFVNNLANNSGGAIIAFHNTIC